MEGTSNFGTLLTNTSSVMSNNFSETEKSRKGKSTKIESSIPPTLSFPPRPTSSMISVLKPPLPPSYPRSRSIALDKAIEYELKHGSYRVDPTMDKQKLRRTISNKLASERARAKKASYILDLENTAERLKEEVSVLTPQKQSLEEGITSLVIENDSLRQIVDKKSDELKIKDMEFELNKLERGRLKEYLLEAGGNKYLQDSIYGPQPYGRFQDLRGSIIVSSVGLQLVSNFGASEHSNDEQPPYLMINQSNELLAEEMNEDDEMDIDKYLNFDAIDSYPYNGSK